MTIVNESVRLFFAIFALILVGMLSAPISDEFVKPAEITEARELASNRKVSSSKLTERKLMKSLKSSRKIARRG